MVPAPASSSSPEPYCNARVTALPLSLLDIATILMGAILGGFVNGLAGFGTGLTALPVWLQVLPPVPAGQLVSATSVASHLATLPRFWRALPWRAVLPLIVSGLAGLPIGLVLVGHVDPASFKRILGVALIAFSSGMLVAARRVELPRGGPAVQLALGFASGVLGGFAGLSGVLPTLWTSVTRWEKDERRLMFQAFNMTMLGAMLLGSILLGRFDRSIALAFLVALPGTFLGSALGAACYGRIDAHRFQQVVLVILLVSGLSLTWANR